MNLSFENKVALVTGAGSGMGLAAARAFAAEGASVVVADVNEAAAPRNSWSPPATKRSASAAT